MCNHLERIFIKGFSRLGWRVGMSGGEEVILIMLSYEGRPINKQTPLLFPGWGCALNKSRASKTSKHEPFSLLFPADVTVRLTLLLMPAMMDWSQTNPETPAPQSSLSGCSSQEQETKLRHYSNSKGLALCVSLCLPLSGVKLKGTHCSVWFLTYLHVVQLLCKASMCYIYGS